jgi:16S rRNA (adenine1518-N6/adenine1519-N6)-dimethyltransferase
MVHGPMLLTTGVHMDHGSNAPKKTLGQHWLEDKATLERISNLAGIKKDEAVLEIGPGLGTLTKFITEKAGRVIAVELDTKLVNELLARVNVDNLEVVNQSILDYDLTSLPHNYKVVANIPYYLTSNLVRVLSESTNPPKLVVLLVQKEVAQRIAAKPGDMSLLSITAQFYWDIELDQVVPSYLFTPPPKVDSQIIKLERREEPAISDIDTKKFFRLVKIGFSARRKTLVNSLTNGFRIEKGQVNDMLNESGINPLIRPQMLSIEDWNKIYKICISKNLI